MIWDFLNIADEWTLHTFLGPINKVITTYLEAHKENTFSEIRSEFPADAKSFQKFLSFTEEQYAAFGQIAEDDYLEKLVKMMSKQIVVSSDKFLTYDLSDIVQHSRAGAICYDHLMVEDLAKACFSFCYANNINDDRSIRGFAKLLITENITDIADVPNQWISQITDGDDPGHYRMEMLLLEQLGYIPE